MSKLSVLNVVGISELLGQSQSTVLELVRHNPRFPEPTNTFRDGHTRTWNEAAVREFKRALDAKEQPPLAVPDICPPAPSPKRLRMQDNDPDCILAGPALLSMGMYAGKPVKTLAQLGIEAWQRANGRVSVVTITREQFAALHVAVWRRRRELLDLPTEPPPAPKQLVLEPAAPVAAPEQPVGAGRALLAATKALDEKIDALTTVITKMAIELARQGRQLDQMEGQLQTVHRIWTTTAEAN